MKRVPVKRILDVLEQTYPDAKCALRHRNPFELLIATMLSAQCTDERVNMVTGPLFDAFPAPEDFARLAPEELEPYIQSCGLFKTKARNIVAACRRLVEEHGGEVPADREALEALPGVGRKTANVVLSNAFGVPAIAVDTHVFRVANRIGLAEAKTPEETERQLMERIPKNKWSSAHHWLIHHGRQICSARSPGCDRCSVAPYCRFAKETGKVGQPAASRRASGRKGAEQAERGGVPVSPAGGGAAPTGGKAG
ncbi:MAG: endonuclease III [Alicyclobacillaceae bacterium]|nr:endonuclease III [Alicyclobacillaceae bacterium]